MFGVYFGRHLMERGAITEEHYEGLLEATRNSKLKMGFLAVEEDMMTPEQAEEINRLQQQEDKRFGDLAIEMGYLTEENVSDLLDIQGDSYLLFVQTLIESGLMDMAQLQEYLADFRKENNLSVRELEDFKTGDVDRIIPILLKDGSMSKEVKDYICLTSRFLVRFIDRFFRMEKPERVNEYIADNIAYQTIRGDKEYFTAFCGSVEELDTIGWGFMSGLLPPGETISYDVLDVAGEYLNVNNGVYVTGLDKEGVTERSDFPVMRAVPTKITSTGEMYRVPLFIEGMLVDLIVCFGEGYSEEVL